MGKVVAIILINVCPMPDTKKQGFFEGPVCNLCLILFFHVQTA